MFTVHRIRKLRNLKMSSVFISKVCKCCMGLFCDHVNAKELRRHFLTGKYYFLLFKKSTTFWDNPRMLNLHHGNTSHFVVFLNMQISF